MAFPAIILCLFFGSVAKAIPLNTFPKDSSTTSSFKNAIIFIDKIDKLEPSKWWPNIKPALFLQNIKTNIHQPLSPYQGRGTNFCGYGAFSYLLLQDDPLGYAKLLLQLYRDGKGTYRDIVFDPPVEIKKAAGNLRFKGILDIRPAEQMWYLCLADHFKGYLNFFNRKYDPGDEDRLWASVNYGKFNRMLKQMLHYNIDARGTDMIHPRVGDQFAYISKRLKTGKVVLYINNRLVHKKNHTKIKLGTPTHYIVLDDIRREGDTITLVYWDYGGKTLMQLSQSLLKRLVYGISYCTKNIIP